MLYKLAHIILLRLPWVWELIEWINDFAFSIRYHKHLIAVEDVASEKDSDALVEFFKRQPDDSFLFFKPHSFDKKTITKLLKRRSMLMHVIYRDNIIVGYCFLRCFFIGKGYRGYIVDVGQQKKGIGKELGVWLNHAAQKLNIRTFKSINNNNPASLHLAKSTCILKKVQEMTDGDIEYECILH